MIKESPFRVIWGVWAVVIYLLTILLLLFYFNSRSDQKSRHFVKKDDHRIEVALSGPRHPSAPAKRRLLQKPKPAPKPKAKPQQKPKPTVKPKPKPKPAAKPKVKSIPKPTPEIKAKPVTTAKKTKPKEKVSNLFKNINPVQTEKKRKEAKQESRESIKELFDSTKSPSGITPQKSDSLKITKSRDSGIENAYFAKVEERLKGWPAQSDYAGEKVKVWLKIEPSGAFDFKVLSASANEAFNSGLVAYLKQLQRLGFDPHKGERAYEIEVEFIATE